MALSMENLVKIMNIGIFGYSPTPEILNAGLNAYKAAGNNTELQTSLVYREILRQNKVENELKMSGWNYIGAIYKNLLGADIDHDGQNWWSDEIAKYPMESLEWMSLPIAMFEAMPKEDKAWAMANSIPTFDSLSKAPFSVNIVREPLDFGGSKAYLEVKGGPNMNVTLLIQGLKNGKPVGSSDFSESFVLDASGKAKIQFPTIDPNNLSGEVPDGIKIQASSAVIALGNSTHSHLQREAAKKFSGKEITVDIGHPEAASLNMPGGSGSAVDPLTYSKDVIITGAAEAGSKVNLYSPDGKTLYSSALADKNGAFSLKVKAVNLSGKDGSYKISVVDKAGNVSKNMTDIYLTSDTKMPDTPHISTQIPVLTNKALVTYSGFSEPGSTVRLFFTNREMGNAVADATGKWTVNIDTAKVRINDGTYKVTAQATDKAGNKSPMSVDVVMGVDSRAPNAPSLNKKLSEFNKSSPYFVGQGEAGSIVSIYAKDAQGVVTKIVENALVGTDRMFSAASNITLNDGKYSFYAQAADLAGNVSKQGYSLAATIDTNPPSAPTLVNSGGIVSNKERVIIKGNSESGATVTFLNASGDQLGSTKANAKGIFSFTTPKLNDGNHVVTIKVKDSSGNSSLENMSVNIKVDTKRAESAGSHVNKSGGIDASGLDSGDTITFNFTEQVTNIRGYTVTGGYKVAATPQKIQISEDGMSAILKIGDGETFSTKLPDGAKFGITLVGVTDVANNVGNVLFDGLAG